ncbi:hypothetical protein HAPAU_37280 [Halalkalicoccus paucihalophilus]|uniref:Uncharacterized protein n=1 Tax=Halalkalicoccus paucihalophilus TaxID=1008153 RepID=A0A151AA66_9EURY|nr:hypothetical protein HAPAU_37280 [Halalkalicoccus paucihalophilus]
MLANTLDTWLHWCYERMEFFGYPDREASILSS